MLSQSLLESFSPDDCDSLISLVDSMPIITCEGRNRKGRVARDITSKGYCSTKNKYYYGIKLHALAYKRKSKIPFPESIILTPASENDLTVFKQNWGDELFNKYVFGDKIYSDFEYFNQKKIESQNLLMFTPVKAIKGQSEFLNYINRAADDLFSTAVSKVRQPIEPLFNWLNDNTNIQRANKVRSTAGLLNSYYGQNCNSFYLSYFLI